MFFLLVTWLWTPQSRHHFSSGGRDALCELRRMDSGALMEPTVTVASQLGIRGMKCPAFDSPILEGPSKCGPSRGSDAAEPQTRSSR